MTLVFDPAIARPRSYGGVKHSQRHAQTRVLREVLIEHVLERVPRAPAEIFNAVWNDFGSAHIRRLWRALAYALAMGAIRRVGPERQSRYVRSGSLVHFPRRSLPWFEAISERDLPEEFKIKNLPRDLTPCY